ncbi:transcriptional regulator, LysR family [Solidesulfovibrio fructosivorans JJ]]|uniref:Transcriptional regulator, LysR family n=1 Tax=Solidesulfovibrio fructosivorans JJ] TaxID=596151 RepID=E1JWY0_SOLFR|nr:LysR family transcriptional regulator [Solidesulfovibrio fructosivorans]EFL51184.1 transcriptional regulator, LysR family [Solidesulfovibrio fructosivorans JJ]]
MRKLLADIPYFIEAANRSSFTQAAEALDIPLATLSRRIAAMEGSLGVRLFFRTTRTIALTEDGKEFLESCKFIMAEANGVKERLSQKQIEPSGPIRLSVEAFVYHCCMHGALGKFTKKYPNIDLHTIFSAEWKDLHREPFDLDIRTGQVPYPELKVRKLLSLHPALYCTADFLKNHPKPKYPNDLKRLPFIAQTQEGRYTLTCSKGDDVKTVVLHPKHTVQSVGLALELLLAGQGVATVIPQLAKVFDKNGDLVQLLPDWPLAKVDINLTLPNDRMPKRIRLFVDHVVEHFQSLQ